MKKHIYIFTTQARGSYYGIGTYVKQLISVLRKTEYGVTLVDLIYKDGTNDYIYVDFNEFNDNYNINQKAVEYGSILRVTVTEKNSVRENLS